MDVKNMMLIDSAVRKQFKHININSLQTSNIIILSSVTDVMSTFDRLNVVLGTSGMNPLTDFSQFKLIVFEGSMSDPLTFHTLKLYRYTLNLNILVVSSNATMSMLVDDFASVDNLVSNSLDYNFVRCLLFPGDETRKEYLPAEEYNGDMDLTKLKDDGSILYAQEVKIRKLMSDLDKEYSHKQASGAVIKQLQDELSNVVSSCSIVNESIEQYKLLLTQPRISKVDYGRYKNPPRVIYLREYNDFPHLYRFVWGLAETLKVQQDKPTKVLMLMDVEDGIKSMTVPHYYLKQINKYNRSKILGNDYIATTNLYVEIVDCIFTSNIGLETLIVVDRRGTNSLIFDIDNLLRFDLIASEHYIDLYNLNKQRCITPHGDKAMCFPHIDSFDTLMPEEKFQVISGLQVYESILNISAGGVM